MDREQREKRIDALLDGRTKRNWPRYRPEIAPYVPEGVTRVLDYGFGDGSLLLGLERDKNVSGLYGIEVNPKCVKNVEGLYNKAWCIDLNEHDAWLEPEYDGFFNYIVCAMSLEHTYDPWYVLKKFNKYLKPGGHIVIEVPNVQSWECLYRMLLGDFPYTSGGTWDMTHIRWYTLKSLIDICDVAGFRAQGYSPVLPEGLDLTHLDKGKPINTLKLPPPEFGSNLPETSITFPLDIAPIYKLFLGGAIVVEFEKVREPDDYEPTPAQSYLEAYRVLNQNPLAMYSRLMGEPFMPQDLDAIKERAEEIKKKR